MRKQLIALLLIISPVFSASAQGVLQARADVDGNGSADSIFKGANFIRIAGGAGTASRTYTFPGSIAILAGGIQNMNSHVPSVEIALTQVATGQQTIRVIVHRGNSVQTHSMRAGWKLLAGGINDLDGYPGAEIATDSILVNPNPAWTTSRIVIITPRDGTKTEYGTQYGTAGYQTWSLLGIGEIDPNSPGLELDYFLRVPDFRGPAYDTYHHRRLYHRYHITYDWNYPSYTFNGGFPSY